MEIKNDITINIATALSSNSKVWKNKKVLWSKFLDKVSKPVITNETYAQFVKATKAEQGKIKDVGGYIGATLLNGRRRKEAVQNKQLITLDIDFSYNDFWWDFTVLYDCAACIHSTHKSSSTKPRHRLIIPLDREVSAEEYEPIARRIASNMNIELFDQSTFETNRLMFWPSISNDAEYYFEYQDGPILSADEILNTYNNWQDISEWPHSSAQSNELSQKAKKQEDPCEKKGIIGVFCRAYTIQDAIEKFLPDIYEKVGENRYTYLKGSTAAGAVVYEDKFLYSNHGTDPAGGRLCNAFDLVRIHLFGEKDADNSYKNDKDRPSFKAMENFASDDKHTKIVLAEEKFEQAKEDFENPIEIDDTYDNSWTSELKVNTKGEYENSATNINLILKNDQILKGAFILNTFDNRRYLTKDMPWRKLEVKPDNVKDVDYSGIRNYIECIYGIASSLKIDDSLAVEVQKQSFHPIREYIKSLHWDGKKRVDTLLIDYFGANDSDYSRATIRKALCAAVARVFKPGIKYDMVLILVGPQGTYKSTFVRKLGMKWFSDTFTTMQGKEAYEQLQGAWIIEMAELSALKKSESENIKQYISKCDDTFRPAYSRTVEVFKRQCIFFGTTNNIDFLKDPTGNRRFNPVDVHIDRATKSVPDDLNQNEIDQIWAETYQIYLSGEKLFFDNRISNEAKREQAKHSSTDERLGVIEEYLNKLLPEDWDKKDLYDRRTWLDDPLAKKGTIEREYVCIAEIWCECLGKDKKDMTRYSTREINEMLKNLDEWEFVSSTKHFEIYGKQKYFKRKTII